MTKISSSATEVDTVKLEQFIETARFFSSRIETAEVIEECFKKISLGLTPAQVVLLVVGATDSGYYPVDTSVIRDRILSTYVQERAKDIETDAFFDLVKLFTSYKVNNTQIEAYFNARISDLTWDVVKKLLAKLRGGSYHSGSSGTTPDPADYGPTNDRIVRAWMNRP